MLGGPCAEELESEVSASMGNNVARGFPRERRYEYSNTVPMPRKYKDAGQTARAFTEQAQDWSSIRYTYSTETGVVFVILISFGGCDGAKGGTEALD